MKNVGIIGLGTITQYYLEGLNDSTYLNLIAVCDTLKNPVSKEIFKDYPFYLDYKEMIEKENLDYIIISTPPKSHFEIAKYALEHNVNVMVEKPATSNLEDLVYLMDLAQSKNLIFEVMYHWQNGSEVIKFNELYDKTKITEINTQVLDPYSNDGITINDDKVKLLGTWVDSGVNILSMIKMWLPFNDITIKNLKTKKCEKTQLPIYIDIELLIDNVKTNINIDWTIHKNKKESFVIYDNKKIIIDHSNQTIIDQGQNKIIELNDMIRLRRHYYNYFTNYKEITNSNMTYLIHKVLFEIRENI